MTETVLVNSTNAFWLQLKLALFTHERILSGIWEALCHTLIVTYGFIALFIYSLSTA